MDSILRWLPEFHGPNANSDKDHPFSDWVHLCVITVRLTSAAFAFTLIGSNNCTLSIKIRNPAINHVQSVLRVKLQLCDKWHQTQFKLAKLTYYSTVTMQLVSSVYMCIHLYFVPCMHAHLIINWQLYKNLFLRGSRVTNAVQSYNSISRA